MKKTGLANLLVLLGLMSFSLSPQAGIPLWEFQPLTLTQLSIPQNSTAVVSYKVTNQSSKLHTLVLQKINGVKQLTGPGLCNNPFVLPSKGSACILSLEIDGSQLTQPITDGPVVCQQGSALQCYRPALADVLKINVVNNEYLLGGTITGLIGQLILLNNGADPLTWNTDGQYTFSKPLATGDSYFVTIQSQPVNQTCTVSNASGVIQANNVSNVNVVCSTNAYTVGGTVSGLSGTVVLQNNGSESLTINSNGSFTFPTPVAQGSAFSVVVQTQPFGQTCSVYNGSGQMGSSNVTSIIVTCATNAYTVGGTVSGLAGAVTLVNNGLDATSVNSNGSFTFATPIAEGSLYNVTVSVQPSGQTCLVSNGSGTMGGGNVTSVAVSCTTNSTQLSVPTTATIPASLSAATNSITVTNIGAYPAYNVAAVLPSGWTAVTQDSSNCAVLQPNNICVLTFRSTQAYVAQGSIVVTGTNVSSPPTLAIAFTVQGYLAWDVSFGAAQVIDLADIAASPEEWDGTLTFIGMGAQSFTQGKDNTSAIVSVLGAGIYAAQSCYSSTNGGFAAHTWYLPALCQMGTGSNCIPGFANINTNLVQLGFGNLGLSNYWSSTEAIPNSNLNAWQQIFDINSNQSRDAKSNIYAVRCAAELPIS